MKNQIDWRNKEVAPQLRFLQRQNDNNQQRLLHDEADNDWMEERDIPKPRKNGAGVFGFLFDKLNGAERSVHVGFNS